MVAPKQCRICLAVILASAPIALFAQAQDCDNNGVPDVIELSGNDCNGNGVLDACDPIDQDACAESPRPAGCAIGVWTQYGQMGPACDVFVYEKNISMSDNRLVVGAYWDDTAGTDSGTVYVYRREGIEWVLESQLFAPPEDQEHHFGISVQVDGDILAVASLGVTSTLYFFRFANGNWNLEDKMTKFRGPLYPEPAISLDNLGAYMALDRGRLVTKVSSRSDESPPYIRILILQYRGGQWEVEAYFDEEAFSSSAGGLAIEGNIVVAGYGVHVGTNIYEGRIRVFEYDGDDWSESVVELPASADLESFGRLGVDVHNGRIVVVGSEVHILESVGGVWMEVDSFEHGSGNAVVLTDDYLAIGDPTAETGLGVTGAVRIYEEIGGAWVQTDSVLPPIVDDASGFGEWFLADDRKMLVNSRAAHGGGTQFRAKSFLYEHGNDCNANGVLDQCDIAAGVPDLDANGRIDACGDPDCNVDGIPDAIEPDCDLDGIPDECEIDVTDPDGDGLVSEDCNGNGVPDECEIFDGDCDGDLILDTCEIAACVSGGIACSDCNANGVLDSCEGFTDCDGDGVTDICMPSFDDCNLNGIPDRCEIAPADPIIPMPELLPFSTNYIFGRAFDVDGDRLVVAYTTTFFLAAPRVVVYRYEEGEWRIEAELTPSDGELQDRFGANVAIRGNQVIVAAPQHELTVVGRGALYVYEFSGGTWNELGKISFWPDMVEKGLLDGNTFVVQSGGRNRFIQRIRNDWEEMDVITSSGSVTTYLYGPDAIAIDGGRIVHGVSSTRHDVYRVEGDAVVFEQSILAPVGVSFSTSSIDIEGDVIAIGSPYYDTDGGVFLYRLIGETWELFDTVRPPERSDFQLKFGESIDLSGGRLHVGAWRFQIAQGQPLTGSVFQFDIGESGVVQRRTFTRATAESRYLGERVRASSTHVIASFSDPTVGQNSRLLIDVGLADDCNVNGTPDACELTFDAVSSFVSQLLQPEPELLESCQFDLNNDDVVDGRDIQSMVDAVIDSI